MCESFSSKRNRKNARSPWSKIEDIRPTKILFIDDGKIEEIYVGDPEVMEGEEIKEGSSSCQMTSVETPKDKGKSKIDRESQDLSSEGEVISESGTGNTSKRRRRRKFRNRTSIAETGSADNRERGSDNREHGDDNRDANRVKSKTSSRKAGEFKDEPKKERREHKKDRGEQRKDQREPRNTERRSVKDLVVSMINDSDDIEKVKKEIEEVLGSRIPSNHECQYSSSSEYDTDSCEYSSEEDDVKGGDVGDEPERPSRRNAENPIEEIENLSDYSGSDDGRKNKPLDPSEYEEETWKCLVNGKPAGTTTVKALYINIHITLNDPVEEGSKIVPFAVEMRDGETVDNSEDEPYRYPFGGDTFKINFTSGSGDGCVNVQLVENEKDDHLEIISWEVDGAQVPYKSILGPIYLSYTVE